MKVPDQVGNCELEDSWAQRSAYATSDFSCSPELTSPCFSCARRAIESTVMSSSCPKISAAFTMNARGQVADRSGAIEAEELILRVLGFDDAIGQYEQPVAGL